MVPPTICRRHPWSYLIALVPFLMAGGCARHAVDDDEGRHYGPKVNVADFLKNTPAYKGKAIRLDLRIDEPDNRSAGRKLGDYVGREVRFSHQGPKGESLSIVINVPPDLQVPDVDISQTLSVRFLCTQGSLHQGNQAKAIELP